MTKCKANQFNKSYCWKTKVWSGIGSSGCYLQLYWNPIHLDLLPLMLDSSCWRQFCVSPTTPYAIRFGWFRKWRQTLEIFLASRVSQSPKSEVQVVVLCNYQFYNMDFIKGNRKRENLLFRTIKKLTVSGKCRCNVDTKWPKIGAPHSWNILINSWSFYLFWSCVTYILGKSVVERWTWRLLELDWLLWNWTLRPAYFSRFC